ncbi:MAG: hypothetical protein V1750_08080 [Acidobacteriota bacterium]
MRLAIGGTLATFHGRFARAPLLEDRVVQSVRRRLEAVGIDPEVHPPSSEVLAQSLLQGDSFPRRSEADDLCHLLALKTLVPWSVADCSRLHPPLSFRLGREGESLQVAGQEVAVAGWPVLADARQVVASPLLDEGAALPAEADEVLLTCFQPADVAEVVAAKVHLARFVVMTWAFRFVEERAVAAGAGR